MKKFYEKVLVVLLVCMMLFSGCAKKAPTADELIAGAWGNDSVESMDVGVNIAFDVDVEAGSVMKIAFDVEADVKSNGINTIVDGNINGSMLGFSFSQPIKRYMVIYDDHTLTLSWNEGYENWDILEDDSEDRFTIPAGINIDSSVFETYELQESEKSDTTYTITGVVSYKSLISIFDLDLENILADLDEEGIDLSNVKFNTTMTFDKESKLCKSILFIVDASSFDYEGVVINNLSIAVDINQINGVDTTIPQEILDSVE